MLHEAGLKVKPIEVTHDSPEVLGIGGRVGPNRVSVGRLSSPSRRAIRVAGMARAATVPRKTAGAPDATVPVDATRTGARTKGGKPFKSERKDRANRKGT